MVGSARVEHVDDVVVAGRSGRVTREAGLAAGRVDDVGVRAVLAVEGQRVAGVDVHRLELVDEGEVLAVAGGRGGRRAPAGETIVVGVREP